MNAELRSPANLLHSEIVWFLLSKIEINTESIPLSKSLALQLTVILVWIGYNIFPSESNSSTSSAFPI